MSETAPQGPLAGGAAERAGRFLDLYTALLPQYPTVSLWRCWEAALFSVQELRGPLLDLGCGDGSILASLVAGGGSRVTAHGLDISAESVALAATCGAYRGVTVCDGRRMAHPDQAFATVVSVCVLEHIPAAESVLSEVARVLKPGGLFAFSVPAPRLLAVAAETHPADPSGFVEAFNERVEHRNVWSAERWAAALAAAGLLVHDIRGFMPPDAAAAWFEAYDWVVRPIRGRGALYRLAGPGLRRFGLGRALASYWRRRLTPWAGRGVSASLEEACALFVTAKRPG